MSKTLTVTALALGLMSLAACSNAPMAPRQGPSDVGNMAYPAPMPQGNVSTTVRP